MPTSRPPLAVFEQETIAGVATETGTDADRLTELVRRHQEGVRELPGVDDIVYEWRNQFHRDPLVHRTDRVYVLALPDHVWDEFADSLDLTETERDTLVAVHDRQARQLLTETSRLDTDSALVLTRP